MHDMLQINSRKLTKSGSSISASAIICTADDGTGLLDNIEVVCKIKAYLL